MDYETELLSGLIELQYGRPVEKKLAKIAEQVNWAKGWPDNTVSFWNAEAFMWSHKIEKQKRALIERELSMLRGGNNLDVGCGAYSYIPSTGLDFSPKMLQFNEQCNTKLIADMERILPLPGSSFDLVTAIFVLNYIHHHSRLVQEVHRVLIPGGRFVMVLSALGVDDWHQQKEAHKLTSAKWIELLQEKKFQVQFYEKAGLWFFIGVKSV